MAKQAPKPRNPTPDDKPVKAKRKIPTAVIVAGLMLAEGAGVYFAVDFLSDKPRRAAAEAVSDAQEAEAAAADDTAEVVVADCRVVNTKGGRALRYSIRVSVLVRQSELERFNTLVEARRSRIDERVNVVVRSAEPKQLQEPGFETLKRRLRTDLAEVLGDDAVVLDVFIPELIQTGGD